MKIRGINHIGLAPKDPEKARAFFKLLGLADLGSETVSSQKTSTHIIESHIGKTWQAPLLEILENEAGKDGPIKKFLEKKGSGLHHLALEVDDVALAIDTLTEKGVRMIDKTPKDGVCKTKVAFVHPESTGGLLVELVESAKES